MHHYTEFKRILAALFVVLGFSTIRAEAAPRENVHENPCFQANLDSRAAWISDMIPTPDGFVGTGGVNRGAEGTDIYILKLDSNCNKVWDTTLGGAGSDEAWALAQTNDGGFIIAGETSSYGAGSWDAYIAKVDGQGQYLWSRTFGGSLYETAKAVAIAANGDIIVAAYTESFASTPDGDIELIRMKSDGTTLWDKTYGSTFKDSPASLILADDGSIFIAGLTQLAKDSSYLGYIQKLNSTGDLVWDRIMTGTPIASMTQAQDGGFVFIRGVYAAESGWVELVAVHIDEFGNTIWEKSYDYADNIAPRKIVALSDGGYAVLGEVFGGPTSQAYAAYAVKLDREGQKLWETVLNDPEWTKTARAIFETAAGEFVIAGSTFSRDTGRQDLWISKLYPR